MPSGVVRVRVRIHGRVQGVWFRRYTCDAARHAGVAGWVANRPDGTVEAVFEGAPPDVRRMIALVGSGPPDALVERVDVTETAGGRVGFSDPSGLTGGATGGMALVRRRARPGLREFWRFLQVLRKVAWDRTPAAGAIAALILLE